MIHYYQPFREQLKLGIADSLNHSGLHLLCECESSLVSAYDNKIRLKMNRGLPDYDAIYLFIYSKKSYEEGTSVRTLNCTGKKDEIYGLCLVDISVARGNKTLRHVMSNT